MWIQAPSGSQARTSPRRVTRSRGVVTGATSSSDPNPNWFGTVYARGSRGARWYIGRTRGAPAAGARGCGVAQRPHARPPAARRAVVHRVQVRHEPVAEAQGGAHRVTRLARVHP